METKTYKGYKIEIDREDSPFNPREDDNLGIISAAHSRYSLSDKGAYKITGELSGWDEEEKALIAETGAVVVLPLYLYDHGGITIKTSPFSCPWDSGRLGFIYATRERVAAYLGIKKITERAKKRIEAALISEVKTFDNYLTGEVYFYNIEGPAGEEVGGCGGWFGSEGLKDLEAEAQREIDYHIRESRSKKAAKLKALITAGVSIDKRPGLLPAAV